MPPKNRAPKDMTYKFMDYWVWVMEFDNEDFEEIDGLYRHTMPTAPRHNPQKAKIKWVNTKNVLLRRALGHH